MNRAPRLVAMVSSCLVAFGCATELNQNAQHTPEEFVHYHKQGTLMRGTKELEVKRTRKAVEADLAEYVSRCINGMVTHTRGDYATRRSSSTQKYTAKLKTSGEGKSILWIQSLTVGYVSPYKMHPDGPYFFAAEIQPNGPRTTKVTSYYLTMSEPYSVEIQEWANGVKNKCRKEQLK